MIVGVVGAGAMGSGIAQVAAQAGHPVIVYDTNGQALERAAEQLRKTLQKLEEKGKLESAESVWSRISYSASLEDLKDAGLVIEAIVENLEIKKKVFAALEGIVGELTVLATNTSSLSVTSIASACQLSGRVIGIHFFNPAPLMTLVEIIPAIQTSGQLVWDIRDLIRAWGKEPVIAKDTPGFIVNRVARPFYGEALRIYEEGLADMATIDWAMKALGGFRMGPFELMDYIGHDVNYIVTETVFASFFYDNRYKPSFSQKRLLEAGWLGRKSGRGFYSYAPGAALPEPVKDEALGQHIVDRVVLMLMNEAIDALYLNIATKEDIDLAMTKGVNYPKGLLEWAGQWGLDKVLKGLDSLFDTYHDERYRASAMLRSLVAKGQVNF
ncbi:MAG: 3-hydroxybutyryl-CoA dehydrogenase [Bacteroidetes bacterium 47-18]|nr:MAG: 3-hydroxybutyryl-CoA dehydrogenase [Bacteroidetes bacterium 47-18]